MFLRLLKLMLKVDREIDGHRQVLFGHKTFSCVDCFRVFDKDGKGHITVEDLEEGFKKWNIEILNLDQLCSLVKTADTNEDDKISYQEFARAITPSTHDCRDGQSNMFETQKMSVEARNVNQQAWMESLAGLFGAIISGESALDEKKEKLQLDGEKIFDSMDAYRMGSVSTNAFMYWIQDNCCYNLKPEELRSLLSRFDKFNEHRITREAFIDAVSVYVEEEENGEDVAEAENK